MVEKNTIVKISFTGKEKVTGRVFDTTDTEIAKKSNIFDEKMVYGPTVVVVGTGQVLKGIDEALLQMKENEEKKIEIPAEKAFGPRDENLVGLIPMKEFKNRNINPYPGLVVNLNDRYAKVQSVSGGRVRVDANHELAGKVVIYDIKIEAILRNNEEQIKALYEKYLPFVNEEDRVVEINKDTVEIPIKAQYTLNEKLFVNKPLLARTVLASIEGIEKVKYSETFEKAKPKEEKK